MLQKEHIQCPSCGSRRARAEGPGPCEGGIFRIACPACGFEEQGIADVGPTDFGPTDFDVVDQMEEEWDEHWGPRPPEPDDGPTSLCEVCGKPGTVQNLPGGVPVSGCFCDEHVPAFVIKPLPILLALVALALAAIIFWLLF